MKTFITMNPGNGIETFDADFPCADDSAFITMNPGNGIETAIGAKLSAPF